MKQVTLKNGSTVPDILVSTTMINLEELISADPIGFYEFVTKCRDQNHRIDPASLSTMTSLHLIKDGETVHDAVRDIVLSAVSGDGLGMKLGSPTTD